MYLCPIHFHSLHVKAHVGVSVETSAFLENFHVKAITFIRYQKNEGTSITQWQYRKILHCHLRKTAVN